MDNDIVEKAKDVGSEDVKVQRTDPGGFGLRHRQVFLFFLGMIFAYALRVIFSVAIVAMTDKKINNDFTTYNWSTSEIGLIKSAFFWGYVLMQIPGGLIAQTWSAQKLLCIGIFISSFSTAIIPLVIELGGWQIFCALRMIVGASQACLLPCVQTLLARWVPSSERARLGTFAYAGAQIGTVITMPISGWLASSKFGWPSIFYLFGATGVAWTLLFFIFGSDRPSESSIDRDELLFIEESLGKSQNNTGKLKIPWKEIMTSMPMWALIVVHCGQNWGYWTLLTEIPTFLSKAIGFNITDNGVLSAMPYLAMWLLSFPTSWLSDAALRRGFSRGSIRKFSNSVAHFGPGLALLALTLVDTRNHKMIITLLVIAVGLNAGSLSGFQINHIDLSPNHAGTMMSITNCIASIIAIVAPIVNNEIVTDQTNVDQWHVVFYVSSFVYFLGNFVFLVLGSGEIQWWNDYNDDVSSESSSRKKDQDKKSYDVTMTNTQTPVVNVYQKSDVDYNVS